LLTDCLFSGNHRHGQRKIISNWSAERSAGIISNKMEGFSYTNIFETKGIEYLIIITFLLLIIPFWITINKRASVKKTVSRTAGNLSAGILKIPQGIFYSRNHTWAHLERSGKAIVGLDDFLIHATGDVRLTGLKEAGTYIIKGEQLALIEQDGKHLKIYSPVSGTITDTNTGLLENSEMLNEDPYGMGWVYKVKPTGWKTETSNYYLADDAVVWVKKELDRFKDFLANSVSRYSPETAIVVLQDGGEFCDNPLRELPDEVWQDFQKSFLN